MQARGTALLAWAEFVLPFVLTDPSTLPISVGILRFQGNYATNFTGILAAGSVLAVLPAMVLFVVLQRHRRRLPGRRAEGLRPPAGPRADCAGAVVARRPGAP